MINEVLTVLKERIVYGSTPALILAGILHPAYHHRLNEIPMDELTQAEYWCEVLGSKVLVAHPEGTVTAAGQVRAWKTDTFGRLARAQLQSYR